MTALPVVTTSERSTFRRCPQRWYWSYRMGLRPKLPDQGALWFGIGIHEALADWYRKGKARSRRHPADVFAEWVNGEVAYVRTVHPRADEIDEVKFEDASTLGQGMLVGYLEEYGRDEQWDVISIETPFSARVTQNGVPIAIFKSTWDGVVRDNEDGEVYLLEHKTASSVSTAYLALDDQAGIYWAIASHVLRARGVLKEDQKIAGILYNFLRKGKPDTRERNEGGAYLNQDGRVSKKQPPPLFVRPDPLERLPQEQEQQMRRLADEVAVMNAMRTGQLPIYKNTNKDCTYCPFFVMCQLHERGGESWREIARADFVQEDPYLRYSKSAGSV